ncbi:MAG: 30S ribosomal protein S6 [bacterium]|nr:30S ribosomal protein S6 [bacterium]
MNQYEVAVVYDPDLEVDLSKAEDRVKKILTDAKAEIVSTDNWGKKKLSYPIGKHESGVYVFYTVKMPGSSFSDVEKTLNITTEVIRYLVVKQDEKMLAKLADAKAAKAKADKGEDTSRKNDEGKE